MVAAPEFSRDPQLLKGVLPLIVLTLLSERESYGYELVTRIEKCGLHGIATGTVYPVLTRLEREGRLHSRLVASDSGPARKYYRPTAAGRQLMRNSSHAWQSLVDIVTPILVTAQELS